MAPLGNCRIDGSEHKSIRTFSSTLVCLCHKIAGLGCNDYGTFVGLVCVLNMSPKKNKTLITLVFCSFVPHLSVAYRLIHTYRLALCNRLGGKKNSRSIMYILNAECSRRDEKTVYYFWEINHTEKEWPVYSTAMERWGNCITEISLRAASITEVPVVSDTFNRLH